MNEIFLSELYRPTKQTKSSFIKSVSKILPLYIILIALRLPNFWLQIIWIRFSERTFNISKLSDRLIITLVNNLSGLSTHNTSIYICITAHVSEDKIVPSCLLKYLEFYCQPQRHLCINLCIKLSTDCHCTYKNRAALNRTL